MVGSGGGVRCVGEGRDTNTSLNATSVEALLLTIALLSVVMSAAMSSSSLSRSVVTCVRLLEADDGRVFVLGIVPSLRAAVEARTVLLGTSCSRGVDVATGSPSEASAYIHAERERLTLLLCK